MEHLSSPVPPHPPSSVWSLFPSVCLSVYCLPSCPYRPPSAPPSPRPLGSCVSFRLLVTPLCGSHRPKRDGTGGESSRRDSPPTGTPYTIVPSISDSTSKRFRPPGLLRSVRGPTYRPVTGVPRTWILKEGRIRGTGCPRPHTPRSSISSI